MLEFEIVLITYWLNNKNRKIPNCYFMILRVVMEFSFFLNNCASLIYLGVQ